MIAEMIFQAATLLAAAGWLVLLLSPLRPGLAQLVSGLVIPVVLAVTYIVVLVAYWGRGDGGFGSLAGITQFFALPEFVLVGWLHYLVFDLFVGAWEVRVARREKIPFALVVPCLVFTFLAAPIGLLAFIALRGLYNLRRTTADV